MELIRCNKCGKELNITDERCNECGAINTKRPIFTQNNNFSSDTSLETNIQQINNNIENNNEHKKDINLNDNNFNENNIENRCGELNSDIYNLENNIDKIVDEYIKTDTIEENITQDLEVTEETTETEEILEIEDEKRNPEITCQKCNEILSNTENKLCHKCKKKRKKLLAIILTPIILLFTIILIIDHVKAVGQKICFSFIKHNFGCLPVVEQKNNVYEAGAALKLSDEFFVKDSPKSKFYVRENRKLKESTIIKKVGKNDIYVYVEYKDKKTIFKKTINIKDTTAPVVTQTSIPSVEQNDKINIIDYIKIVDNSDEDTKKMLKDYTLDTTKLGNNKIKLTIKDSSANTTEFEFSYSVVVFPDDFNFKYTSEVKVNEKVKISELTFSPSNTTEKSLEFYDYDKNILSVNNNGDIIAVNAGTSEILVKTKNNIVKKMEIKVYKDASVKYSCNYGTLSGQNCLTTSYINASGEYACYSSTYRYNAAYGKCFYRGSEMDPRCPSGYSYLRTPFNGTCHPIQEAYIQYTCSRGKLQGTQCLVTNSTPANKSYYCGSGYYLEGQRCYKN